jgi:hypothetical protein
VNSKFLIRNFILKLPRFLRAPLIRKTVQFPKTIDPNLKFKIAETQDELAQAFAILHDSYVGEGLMKPHRSGLRVTKYHLLPSTTTLIALQGEIVIGTVSLVRQNGFGLPIQSIFNLDQLPLGSRVAEVSSLAIRKGYQQDRGRILFPLLKFMYQYSVNYFGVTHLLIAVNPKWFDFYDSVLLFKKLSKKTVKSYSFVNGAPAVGGILNLQTAQSEYQAIYGKKSVEKNLAHFFLHLESPHMQFPHRKMDSVNDPVMTARLMDYFFLQQTDVLAKMTAFEIEHIRELYNIPEYLKLIPRPHTNKTLSRVEKRFETKLFGRIHLAKNQTIKIQIQNSNFHGLDGFTTSNLPEGEFSFSIDLDSQQTCILQAQVIRVSPNGAFAAHIKNPTARWTNFINGLNEHLLYAESRKCHFSLAS